jgi:hypothetical protein
VATEAVFQHRSTPKGDEFTVHPLQTTGVAAIWIGLCILLFMLFWWSYVGLVFLAFGGIFFAKLRADQSARKPVTIVVSSNSLVVNGTRYAKDDIATVYLKAPNDTTPTLSTTYVGTGITGLYTGALFQTTSKGHAIGQRYAYARSFSLMLRRRSISTPVRLIHGLTQETGEALVDDLAATMR